MNDDFDNSHDDKAILKKFPPILRAGEFVRLGPEEGKGWHEVRNVGPSAAYVRPLSTSTRTFTVSEETVRVNGLEYKRPLAEPKQVTVAETARTFAISRYAFVYERSGVRP